ncbi:tRNA selenocysteine 1-associated protein 1-like [Mytilus trossulus]|uniref:tRNA selenocysteine 1-associated protein 1-like n=1 Tax=Mytilus trossulus TaxID=6551 RepID=UPI0030050FC0
MAVICTTPTLWMGDLESDWDEEFITKGFQNMGITIRSLKIIKNKVTGLPAGYCFVDFTDKDKAQEALLKLNGKVIPGTTPVRRFKLNSAGYGKDSTPLPEYSLFVGELSDDVDDYVLYQAFAKRYRSCRSVKIVTDSSGRSKGYGFIRFTEENDQQRALIEMQHFPGISRRPIRVSLATPKRPLPPDVSGDVHYSHYYGHNYPYSASYYQYYGSHTAPHSSHDHAHHEPATAEDEMDTLEEPELEIDVFRYNKDFMEQSEEVFEAIELSRWTPLDSITSKLPPPMSI